MIAYAHGARFHSSVAGSGVGLPAGPPGGVWRPFLQRSRQSVSPGEEYFALYGDTGFCAHCACLRCREAMKERASERAAEAQRLESARKQRIRDLREELAGLERKR